MKKRLITILLMLVGVFLWSGLSEVRALSIYFDQATVSVIEGNTFDLNLLADTEGTEALLGWDVDLSYDSSQVEWMGTTVNTSLWEPVSLDSDGLGGLRNFLATPPQMPISGDGILLATLHLRCLAVGTSILDISTNHPFEGFAGPDPGQLLKWTSTPTTVNQNPIPEPGTLFLMASGLVGLVGWSRRQGKRS